MWQYVRLSAGFCRLTNITRFNYTLLFYDSRNNAVAFKFINIRETGALKVTKDRNGATISARSFLKVNNIILRSFLADIPGKNSLYKI